MAQCESSSSCETGAQKAYTFFTECGAEVYVDENGDEWDIEYEVGEWGDWESCNDEDEEDPDFDYEYTYWDDEEDEDEEVNPTEIYSKL